MLGKRTESAWGEQGFVPDAAVGESASADGTRRLRLKEMRSWTISIGATAPRAVGVIHADFEKGFIRVEVIGYDAFVQFKGEQGAKNAGKWRLEGKEYVMHDGDVVHFRFNV